ncbi:sensor histidine kinase [Methylophaga sp. OBS3]|uniref:sensor histidine kinase n=1 Tax=Methylophaga sp. OBS3 TaxID=2991934 RepID=UPI0022582F36|nr:sensor histidine kinase [Methylophaga sp. OBS3]MCX4190787.1 ATP-binding protein [Methylophaga sp. OBS3]
MHRIKDRFNTIQGSLLFHELSFVLIIILTTGLGGSWVLAWQNNSQESLRLTALNTHMQHVRGDLYRQIKEVFDVIFLDDSSAVQQYFGYSQTINRELNQMQLLARSESEQQQVQKIADTYDAFYAETQTYVKTEDRELTDKQLLLLDQPLEQFTLNVFEILFHDFEEYLQSSQSVLAAKQQRWLTQVFWMGLLPILLALGLLIWSRHFVKKQVLMPLTNVIEGARHVAQGEWRYALPEHGVADLKHLTAAINQMATDLINNHDNLIEARKQAEMADLIPLVAHNIRNPLAGIRAAAQVSLSDKSLPEQSRQVSQDIIVAVDRLERWVTSLLMYLHPMQPHFSSLKLTTLADNALSLIQMQITDKQLTVEREGWENDLHEAQLDGDLIEQTLCNLIQNAIEASPDASELRLRFQRLNDGRISLEIDDQGRGMKQPYSKDQQSESDGRKPLHCGLGLPFADRVMHLHGGEISHIGLEPGTRVRIELPINQPEMKQDA